MEGMRLSVLDQSPISEGSTGSDALHHTIDLARLADELGYHRYWVAEHHGGAMLAGPSPEVLIGPIAAATQRIRVGSGGVMLPHYSPFKVAESFSLLAGLYGDRIDLGIGRAAGTDPMTSHALQRDRSVPPRDDFPDQLAELLAYLQDERSGDERAARGRIPAEHPFARLTKLPGLPEHPQPWLLGSSAQSAIWAAQLGLPYAFADFINSDGSEIAGVYRERFDAGQRLRAARTAVAVWALAADTDEEAEALASSAKMAMAMLRRGRLISVPPVETALRFLASSDAPARPGRRTVVGTPERVRTGLEDVAADYGADEVIVVTITHSHEARKRSYSLIAEAFGLEAAEP